MNEQLRLKLSAKYPRLCPRPRIRRGPLRTAFVITSMPVGGAEVLLANLIRQLDPKRILPELVCLKDMGPLGEALRSEVPVHSNLLAGKWDLRILPRLVKLFQKREIDAVVTVGAGDKMFWGRLAAQTAGTPVILSALHSTGWPDTINRLNRSLTKCTDGFIAVATDHARYLQSNEGFPAERIYTIRNGVDTERFIADPEAFAQIRTELGIRLSSPVIGIVAALRPEKNHMMFLRVARRILELCPDAHFLIVGDGPERPRIEGTIAELGLQNSVHLLGTRHDTHRLLATMDLFLLCSQNEASPVSILEALSCQVPVIATRVGSIPETVIDGETGFLVNVDDDAAMSERIFQVLGDFNLFQSLGKNGRDLVLKQGSLSSMVEGYSALVEGLYDERVRKTNPPHLLIDRRRVARAENEATSQSATVPPVEEVSA